MVAADEEDFTNEIPFWVHFCANLAPFTCVVVFWAPMPTIRGIVSDQTAGDMPLLPYSSMICNCSVWIMYGVLLAAPKVWSANMVGLLLGVYYFLQFIRFCPDSSPTLPGSIMHHFLGISGIVIGCAMLGSYGAELVGNLGVTLCICLFASPLAALRAVFKTKSAKSIPLPFTFATIINCFMWVVMGALEMNDPHIYIPNLLGLTLAIFQLILKCIYGDGKAVSLPL